MAIKKKAKAAAKKVKKAAKSVGKKLKATVKRGGAARSAKRTFLDTYAREHQTTLKVLRAFPPGQGEFRTHPRQQTLNELAYTMLFEQELNRRALNGGPIFGGGNPPVKPASFEAAIEQFDKGYQAVVDHVKRTPDAKLDATVQFPTGPGQMGDWPIIDFLWFMLFDQIHHRGQMSVMVRMAGGKVPAIYGPSGDEPWT